MSMSPVYIGDSKRSAFVVTIKLFVAVTIIQALPIRFLVIPAKRISARAELHDCVNIQKGTPYLPDEIPLTTILAFISNLLFHHGNNLNASLLDVTRAFVVIHISLGPRQSLLWRK